MKPIIEMAILAGYKSVCGEPFTSTTMTSLAMRVASVNAVKVGWAYVSSLLFGWSLIPVIFIVYGLSFVANFGVLLLLNSKYSFIAD